MGPDRDAVLHGQPDGVAHDRGIARVKPAREIGRGHVRHDELVVAKRVGAERLAEIAV